MNTPTKAEYEEWLDELGVPQDDLKSAGGRIPDDADYGRWLRSNDPIAFNVGYYDWCSNANYRRTRA